MRSFVLYALLGAAAFAFVHGRTRGADAGDRTQGDEGDASLLAAELPLASARAREADLEVLRSDAAERLHRDEVAEFASAEGFGVARMPLMDPVAGPFELDGSPMVAEIRLIGAWAHDEARLYRGGTLGNHREMLANHPWDPLSELDRAAVRRLAGGDELVITRDRSVLYGALRAGETCAKCHEIPVGTMLGAFRYQLIRLTENAPGPR
jgi:hypothetical protein